MSNFFYSFFISFFILLLFVVVAHSNPVTSLIALITLTFFAAIVLLMEKLHFLPWVLIIVYVGAVAMLFLFVIMLMNPISSVNNPLLQQTLFWFLLAIFHSWNKIYSILYITILPIPANLLIQQNFQDNIVIIAFELYEDNFILIVMLTWLLLATLISSFVLAKK